MPRCKSSFDGAELFYRDYVPATQPPPFAANSRNGMKREVALVLLHQWPLSSRMYEPLMLKFCESYGFRCIAPDRRGFGGSDWSGPNLEGDITYEVLAKDVLDILEQANPGPFIFIAASMATGEVLLAHSLSSYVQENCKGSVWISTSLPHPVASSDFPNAPPREVWDSLLDSLRNRRSQFISTAFHGPLGVGPAGEISTKEIELYERIFDAADGLAIERAVQIYTSEDLTNHLRQFSANVHTPMLLIHGGADEGMPAEASADRVSRLVPHAKLILYKGGGHVLVLSHSEQLIQDILKFIVDI